MLLFFLCDLRDMLASAVPYNSLKFFKTLISSGASVVSSVSTRFKKGSSSSVGGSTTEQQEQSQAASKRNTPDPKHPTFRERKVGRDMRVGFQGSGKNKKVRTPEHVVDRQLIRRLLQAGDGGGVVRS